jgi:hypothetical protein
MFFDLKPVAHSLGAHFFTGDHLIGPPALL